MLFRSQHREADDTESAPASGKKQSAGANYRRQQDRVGRDQAPDLLPKQTNSADVHIVPEFASFACVICLILAIVLIDVFALAVAEFLDAREDLANRVMNHHVGDRIKRCRVAVDNDKPRA